MFGMFKKKATLAKAEVKKFEKRDLMEATVGGCLLVAFADGSCDDGELKTIDNLLRTSKALEGFGAELTDTINRFSDRLRASFLVARTEIMREIADVKGDRQEAEDVLLATLTVALADGNIEDAEQKVLNKIAENLGLRLQDYLDE